MTRTVAFTLALALAACGGDDGRNDAAPVKVPPELVPTSLASGALTLDEDGDARERFGRIEGGSLVDDGRLWAVRDGDRLVATLQLSTLDPKVDLGDADELNSLVTSLLPGSKERFTVGDLTVVSVATEDKTVYLWFGRSMFQVLQVKTPDFDHEDLLGELIAYQTASDAWEWAPRIENE